MATFKKILKEDKQDISPAKSAITKDVNKGRLVGDQLRQETSASSLAKPKSVAPAKNKVIKQVLADKKTIRDNKGDVWELTEKRDKV